jgi:hypothetical protein
LAAKNNIISAKKLTKNNILLFSAVFLAAKNNKIFIQFEFLLSLDEYTQV